MSRPATPLRAAVFDLDGTLADNMRYHGEAWIAAVAQQFGYRATWEDVLGWAGKKADEIVSLILGRRPSAEEVARVEGQKEAAYRVKYRPHLAEVPGLTPFLRRLKGAGIRLAVATASPAENRALVLEGLGLTPFFEVVIGPEGAARGKPAPDIFLSALAALGLPPSECLAFEDAVNGIIAAREAGMEAVGITTTVTAEQLARAGACCTISDFAGLPSDLEARLFAAGRRCPEGREGT